MNKKHIKRHIVKLALLVILISNHGYKLCLGFQRAMNIELSPGKHIIRACLFHSVHDSGDKVQARDQNGPYSINNPAEIEVLPDENSSVQAEAGEFEVLSVKFGGFWIWWQKPQFKIKGDGSAEFSMNKGPKDTTRYRTTFNLSKEHLRQLNELLKKTGWLTKPGANEEPKYTDASRIDITLVRKGEVKKVWCHDRNPEPYLSLVNFLKRIHRQEYLLNRMKAAGERERIDAFREINQELRSAEGDPVVAHPRPVLDYHRLLPVCKEVITHTDDNHRDVIVTALKLFGLLRIESERDTITKLTTAKQTSSKPEWTKSKTERVRSAAINSLVKFGGEESRQHLRKIAPNHRNFDHRVNDAIVAGLLELDGELSIELLKDMASTTRVAAWALIRLGPASVPAIVEILERPYNAHDSGPSNVIRAYIDNWERVPKPVNEEIIEAVREDLDYRLDHGSGWTSYYKEFLKLTGGAEVMQEVKEGALEGTIIASNGKVAADYEIRLLGAKGSQFNEFSNKEGNYSFSNVPAGLYQLVCNPKNKSHSRLVIEKVRVRENETTVENMSFESRYTFSGKVSYADGRPAVGITVLGMWEWMGSKVKLEVFTKTNGLGRYTLGAPFDVPARNANVGGFGTSFVGPRKQYRNVKPGRRDVNFVLITTESRENRDEIVANANEILIKAGFGVLPELDNPSEDEERRLEDRIQQAGEDEKKLIVESLLSGGIGFLQRAHDPATALKWFEKIPMPPLLDSNDRNPAARREYEWARRTYCMVQEPMAKCEIRLGDPKVAEKRIENLIKLFPELKKSLHEVLEFEVRSALTDPSLKQFWPVYTVWMKEYEKKRIDAEEKSAVPIEGEQTLGDVVELVVNANNLENRYVDLDTGTVFSYPKNMNTDSETEAAWREQKRIDMTFLLVDRKPSKIVHLLSCNMIAAPVSEDKWSCTEEELMLDAKKAERERRFFPVESANDSIVAKTDGDAAYPTFVFKTREGNVGVLQVLEILRNGQWDRQAKMRYRLLRNPSVKIEDDQIVWGEAVDGIVCAVKPAKESFLAGETLEFDIVYKNVSGQPITICTYPDNFYVWTQLWVVDSSGTDVARGQHGNGIRRPMNVSDFVTLQPGQTASVREKIAGHRKGKPRLKAGKYAAKVSISGINRMEKYVPNFDGFCKKHNIKPWTGVIKSGPAAFMVIPMPEIQWGEEAEGLHVGIGEPEVKDGSIKVPAFLRNKRSDDKKHFDGADYQIILNNKLYLSYQWPALNGRQVTVYPEQVRGPFWIDLSDYVNESNRDQSYQADRPLKQLPKGKYNLRVIYVGRNGKPRISSPEINVTIPDDSSWGESVEGLQVWLRTDKMVWRMGETPTFSLDLRNNGKKVFNYVRIMEAHCRIEYDGQWYIWADPIMISAPTWPLRPGIQVNGAIKVKLVKSWGIKMGGKERLELTPGRHMVRVRFTPGGGEVQAESNPVEIEILAVGVKPAIMEGVKQIDVLSWGEAVEGVQCRLRADKQIWKTNETVTFKADIRNQGNKRWGIGPERWKRKFCEVEFDGAWHSWPYPASVHLPDGVLQENHQFNDVLIPLDERLGGVNVTPGRHVVRVAFFREPVNPANRVVSKPVEIEILPTEKSDVQVEGGKKREGQSPKDVILPDVDTKALMLDLATGELVDTPKVRGKIALWTAIERFGKGDLVYDAKALTLVRGATTQAATEKIVGPFKAYRISQTLPEVLIIKTKEGREYVVKIFSADKESCRLEYYLQTTPDVQVEGEGSKGQGKLRDQEEPTYAGRSLTELIAALSDQDFQTRINAVYHLGYMGQKAKPAVPALVDALNQKPLRESVLHSLGNIGVGAEDAIPALMKAIAEYPSTCRWKAAVALANIGEGSVASLEEGAKSEKMYLRIWCNAALAKQKESDSPNLRYLAKAMKRSDRSTAVEAVRALTMLGPISKPLVPDFIEALKQSNVPEKDVAFALAQIGQDAKAAVPELVKMIQSTNPSTQRDAIYALSAIGGEDAAPAVASLIQALASKDKLVRREAANALGNIGLPASTAIEQLANILKDEDEFVRQNAAQALGKIDLTNLEPVPALIVAMKDKSFRVRRAAGTTLLRIGPANKEIIFAFIRVAQDNWKYFKTIGREYIGPSNTLIQSCERFFGLLGPRQSYIVPDLIEMLRSSEKQSHLPAIWALGRIGKAAKPAVPYILESMKNPDLQERALEALRKISPQAKAAVPGLVKMLEDKHKRFSAAAALEGIGPAAYEAIPALQNHLGYSGVTFARALLAIDPKSSKAIEALVKIAESPYVPNQWTEQPDAHYLLVKYGHDKDRHLQGLIDALENPNSRIRLSAAAYLGKLGAEANEAAESLGRALKDDDPEVRAEAARAILLISLRASERKEACNTIAALLAGKDFTSLDGLFMAQVRAAGALTSFGPLEEWAVPLLIAKVQDDSIRTRVAAIKAFGNIGPGAKEAIPYLKRLLKAENWQIRQSAAQAIEKIDNKTDVQVEAKSLSSRLKDRWLLEAKQSIDAHNTGRFGIYFGIKYVGIPELSQMPDEDIVISHRVKSLKMGDIPIDMNDLVGEVSIRNKTGFGRFFLPEQIEGLENLKPGKYPVTLLLEGHIYEAKRPDKILGQWRVELEEEIKLSDMFLRDAISWITWGERRGTNIHSRCAQSWPA